MVARTGEVYTTIQIIRNCVTGNFVARGRGKSNARSVVRRNGVVRNDAGTALVQPYTLTVIRDGITSDGAAA